MSWFQCEKCGCKENTAVTKCSHAAYKMNLELERDPCHLALLSYKKILGLRSDQEFGHYCSVCCPVWRNGDGEYGIGPNPNPIPGCGQWHNKFERIFLPKEKFKADRRGNLIHTETLDPDIKKWKLDKEDGT